MLARADFGRSDGGQASCWLVRIAGALLVVALASDPVAACCVENTPFEEVARDRPVVVEGRVVKAQLRKPRLADGGEQPRATDSDGSVTSHAESVVEEERGYYVDIEIRRVRKGHRLPVTVRVWDPYACMSVGGGLEGLKVGMVVVVAASQISPKDAADPCSGIRAGDYQIRSCAENWMVLR